ncbi:hypothetical protein AVEN_37471-1 [Araneus ventricosus]|uniref:Uncharacterized protein n=1 Tax=Araneus ventricosus TaxID=182803 RepID=A0A4Y2MJ62_ARAVE|nr:hypothetical protein AVEN_231171-1 [Araneus ventricosus]GBN27230.1 hypothetical protein AVEN_37471-1 [Araneus ventricosus]
MYVSFENDWHILSRLSHILPDSYGTECHRYLPALVVPTVTGTYRLLWYRVSQVLTGSCGTDCHKYLPTLVVSSVTDTYQRPSLGVVRKFGERGANSGVVLVI